MAAGAHGSIADADGPGRQSRDDSLQLDVGAARQLALVGDVPRLIRCCPDDVHEGLQPDSIVQQRPLHSRAFVSCRDQSHLVQV